MSQDLLYINEQLADIGEFKPKITRQRNNFAKLQEVKSDFAKISLPPTKNNKKIFEHVELWGSTSTVPYQYLEARLYLDGEPFTPFGRLALDDIDEQGFYECVIYTGVFPLFDTLSNLKMEDLDLSEYSHFLTLTEVTNRNSNPTNIFYPIFNDGYGISGNVSLDRLVPFIKNDVLVQKIFKAQGFTVNGTFIQATELTNGCTACLGNITEDVYNNSNPAKIGYDITQSDYVKELLQLTNSIVTNIDYFTNTIEINTLKSISSNSPVKIEVDKIINQSFDLSGVSQRNYFKYENEDNETIGQNILTINNTRLDVESDAIDSEIKALEQSLITLDSETETVDTIYVFEDEGKVRDNLEEGDTSKYRTEVNNDELFITTYTSTTKSITYEQPSFKFVNTASFSEFTSGLQGVAIDGNTMYVLDSTNTDILELDISEGINDYKYIRSIDVSALDGNPAGLSFSDGFLYLTGSFNNNVYKLDITNDTAVSLDSKSIGGSARGVSIDGDYMYVADTSTDNVIQYDISSGLASASSVGAISIDTYLGSLILDAVSVRDGLMMVGYRDDSGTNFYMTQIDISAGIGSPVIDGTVGLNSYTAAQGIFLDDNNIYTAGSSTVNQFYYYTLGTLGTQTGANFPFCNFSILNWSVLNDKYYQQWLELFQEYREITILAQLTGQEVNDFDFKNPVYISNEYGSQKFLVERIENYQKGKPTKVKLLKL